MKRFWNLMFAALVIMGAVACTENEENVEQKPEQQAGMSFEATIDLEQTRTDVVFNEGTGKWDTVWTGVEALRVYTNDSEGFYFTNTVEDKNRFTCYDDGVESLIGQDVYVSLVQENNGMMLLDSKAGKCGGNLYTYVENFDPAKDITLHVQTAFLRYSSEYEVTLACTNNSEPCYVFQYDENIYDTVTLPAGDDVWVAFVPFSSMTLSYSINGIKCKEVTMDFAAKKIYNLGELGLPYTVSATWGIAGDFNGWTAGTPEPLYEVDDLLVAYNLTGLNNGFKFVQNKGWDGAKGSKTMEAVASGEWLYCGDNNIVAADASAYDVYFSPARSMYYIVAAGGEAPVLPEVEPIVWSLAGSFNSWGDTLMAETETANLYVAKGVELKTGDEIKVKDSKTWDTSYGGGINNLEANKWMKAYFNGSNVVVAKSGAYDVYFEYAEGAEYSKLYLIEAEGDYTAATEQTANGTLVPDGGEEPEQPEEVTPDQPSAWSLSGTFNSWGDTVMVTTTVKDVYVAKSLTLEAYASFKVRKDKAWTENYGGGIVYFNPNGWMELFSAGSDISNTEAGTFDIYFDYANKRLYMVTAGGDYTAVAQQTTEGKEPVQEEPEVTEKMLYLKPNANWKQSNARFAAYFWNDSGNTWVSMTDSDNDGIYELYIPEGYDYGCNIIFCRMNPSTTANNWNNKWNQTSDLKAPTDGKNLYTVKDGTWDKGGGTWSVK